MRLDFR
jgi:hypothetical protein